VCALSHLLWRVAGDGPFERSGRSMHEEANVFPGSAQPVLLGRGVQRNMTHIACLLVTAALGGACAGHKEVARARPYTPAEYRLGVEDVVQVAVFREPELGVTAPVRPDGKLTIPAVGEIAAAGRTARELEEDIGAKLKGRISAPVVSVVVKEVNAARVFVLGEVARPGAYPLRGAMTVLQVLALAGGVTDFAARGDIVILRRGNQGGDVTRIPVDYSEAVKGTTVDLYPGDTVVVP
jgi:polysaccharide biosynthesis/export protein